MTLTHPQLDLYPVAESFPLTGAQATVLGFFRRRGNFTDMELNDYVADIEPQGWVYDTPRKRRRDLTKLGLIRWDGTKRLNRQGSQEKVWVLHV